MSFFDFSDDVERAVYEAEDQASRLSAKTAVHRARFPAAVKRAGFRLLYTDGSFIPGKHDLVIGAAPWSGPDLAALEDLVVHARSGNVRISVFDIDDIRWSAMVSLLPGIRRFTQTPVVLQYRHGELTYFGQGHDAVLWLRQL
jgi:hypothetical protein